METGIRNLASIDRNMNEAKYKMILLKSNSFGGFKRLETCKSSPLRRTTTLNVQSHVQCFVNA